MSNAEAFSIPSKTSAGCAKKTVLLSSSTKGDKSSKPSFFRRKLPSNCIALSSKEGRELFASAHETGGVESFFPLVEQFVTQSEPAFCGISTLVIVLNALSVDPRQTWKGPWRWYEESMLNCCLDLEQVKKSGITFSIFLCLSKCQGLSVVDRLASDSAVGEFREAVKKACSTSDDGTQNFLVASYSRKIFGQTGDGHFSPIAAYDAPSDMVLILDTARFKYGPHWVPLERLFDAMKPIDPDSKQSRGYVLLSYPDGGDFEEERGDKAGQSNGVLPQSILFRVKHVQDVTRSQYKDYLAKFRGESKDEISFDDVISYWTKDEASVWDMMQSALVPIEPKEKDRVCKTRELLKGLIQDILPTYNDAKNSKLKKCCPEMKDYDPYKATVKESFVSFTPNIHNTKDLNYPKLESHEGCSFNSNRRVPATAGEALYVVYLSSLSVERRKEIIYDYLSRSGGDNDDSTALAEQILAEAELVQYAIEVSDASL